MRTTQYIAGKHNIGSQEIRKKWSQALFWFAVTLLVIAIFFNAGVERLWRLIIFIPAIFLAIYAQQWLFQFSIRFGIKGEYNFGELGEKEEVLSEDDKKNDFMKAWQIYYSSFFLGMGITSIVYYWG